MPVKTARRTRKTSDTVERILESARRVLIRDGYAGFSIRNVAAVAGMQVGNLTYHFPNKRDLLRAVIAKLLDYYSQGFSAYLPNAGARLPDAMANMIRWVLTDATARDTVRVFRELWVVSLHDREIARAVDDFYDAAMNRGVQLLRRSRPRATLRSMRELAQMITLLSEGTTVLYGTRSRRAVSHERVIALAIQFANLLMLRR